MEIIVFEWIKEKYEEVMDGIKSLVDEDTTSDNIQRGFLYVLFHIFLGCLVLGYICLWFIKISLALAILIIFVVLTILLQILNFLGKKD